MIQSFKSNAMCTTYAARLYKLASYITVISIVLTMLTGYLSVSESLHEVSRGLRQEINSMILWIWGSTLIIIVAYAVSTREIELKLPASVWYAYFVAISSGLLIAGKISPVLLIGAAFFTLYFSLLKTIHALSFSKSLLVLFVSYNISPVALYILNFSPTIPFFWFDGFRGLTFDRVEYAFFAGLALLILIVDKRFTGFLSLLAIVVLVLGIFLSQTRFVYPALFLSLITYKSVSTKTLFYASAILSLFAISSLFGSRVDYFDTGRSQIYFQYFDYISANPELLFFGSASLYHSFNDGVVPHNLLMQSVLNFGLLGFSAWVFLVIRCIKTLSKEGRSIIVYLHIFGLFHPGVDAFLVTPTIAFVFLLAIGFRDTAPRHRSLGLILKTANYSPKVPS